MQNKIKRGLKKGFQERAALTQENSHSQGQPQQQLQNKSSFLGRTSWEFDSRGTERGHCSPKPPWFSRPGPAQLPPFPPSLPGRCSLPALPGGSRSSQPSENRDLLLPEPGTFPGSSCGGCGPGTAREGTPKISRNYRGTALEPGRGSSGLCSCGMGRVEHFGKDPRCPGPQNPWNGCGEFLGTSGKAESPERALGRQNPLAWSGVSWGVLVCPGMSWSVLAWPGMCFFVEENSS